MKEFIVVPKKIKKYKTLYARVEADIHNQVKQLAERHKTPINDLIIQMVVFALKHYKK